MSAESRPYKSLGEALMKIRGRLQESLAEVSGAVEIDSEKLVEFEEGLHRPSEDTLDMLIAHFSVKEEEAARLWKLAGYEETKNSTDTDEPQIMQQPVMLLPFDARVIYTDTMNVVIDKHGVVINFMQTNGNAGQQLPAARVGMSLEYAQKVADTLQETIKMAKQQAQQKNLPGPREAGSEASN